MIRTKRGRLPFLPNFAVWHKGGTIMLASSTTGTRRGRTRSAQKPWLPFGLAGFDVGAVEQVAVDATARLAPPPPPPVTHSVLSPELCGSTLPAPPAAAPAAATPAAAGILLAVATLAVDRGWLAQDMIGAVDPSARSCRVPDAFETGCSYSLPSRHLWPLQTPHGRTAYSQAPRSKVIRM